MKRLGSSFVAFLVVLMVFFSLLGGPDVRREAYSLQATPISSEEESLEHLVRSSSQPEVNVHNQKRDDSRRREQSLNKAQTNDDWLNYIDGIGKVNHVDSLPEPVQIVREYLAWHSNETLGTDEIYNGRRKYIVVQYNCPHQAGNGMTLFLNSFLMAILTNRTLVWQSETGEPLDECDRVLHRAPWIPEVLPERLPGGGKTIPRWNVWTEIKTACAELFQSRRECIAFFQKHPNRVHEMAVNSTEFLAPKKRRVVHQPVFRLNYLTGCWHSDIFGWWARFNLTDPTCRLYLKARLTAGNNDDDDDDDGDFTNNEFMDDVRLRKLFRHGLYFLYGLLFDAAFRLTDEMLGSVEEAQQLVDPTAYSVAVHSRHIFVKDDGSDITREVQGLAHFFNRSDTSNPDDNKPALDQHKQKKCQLIIMSDRTATTRAMYDYAHQNGCQAVALHPPTEVDVESSSSALTTATQRQQGRRILILDQSDEHGPFAGAAFYQDLALVSLGRNGIVGSDRSSTALAVEKMAFDNFQRAWKIWQQQQQQQGSYSPTSNKLAKKTITNGEFCCIGGKGSRGYKCRSWAD